MDDEIRKQEDIPADPADIGDVTIEESDEDGETGNPEDTIKKLREKLKKAVAEKQEYLDGWQRHRADFLNYRKRMEEEVKAAAETGKAEVLHDLASVVESFDMAFANKEAWEKVDKSWRIGIEYIHTQLIGALEGHGMKSFAPEIGAPFDETAHAAVETVPTNDKTKDHTVANVIQKGFMLGKNVVRPPKVRVYAYQEQGQ